MTSIKAAVLVIAIAMFAAGVHAQQETRLSDPNAAVRINQIQVIGTHNSYHAGLLPGIAKLMQQKDPAAFSTLDYTHSDLATQFDHGIRQIELDIFADSKGGRFAHPVGQAMVAHAGLPADPEPYTNDVMLKPGFKVMHIQDVDYVSTCQPFIECLQIVHTWSKAHPRHVPIFILVETKEGIPNAEIPWTTTEPYTAATFDALDTEIRSVFSSNEMITPDQVRGRYPTLNEAVRNGGWPTLAEARGKVVFLLEVTRVGPIYLEGHPDLRGRVLFTNSTPGQPDCAYSEENDTAKVSSLVRQGYLIRSQSDADTVEARTNDTARRDKVLRCGAQIVSTDYPQFEPARWTGYAVALPDKLTVRCNPVIGPRSCIDKELEPTLAH